MHRDSRARRPALRLGGPANIRFLALQESQNCSRDPQDMKTVAGMGWRRAMAGPHTDPLHGHKWEFLGS